VSSMDFDTRLAIFAMERDSAPDAGDHSSVSAEKRPRAKVGKTAVSAFPVLLALAAMFVGLS